MLVNGQRAAQLPVDDRGLHYGDGLFETIAVTDGRPRQWPRHMARLARGCRALQLPPPDSEQLLSEAGSLCEGKKRAVLKLIITRGSGGRGYRFPDVQQPTRILTLHPSPEYPHAYYQQGVTLTICNTRLGINPQLAGIKHLNRLEQVLARNELPADCQEGVMCDVQGKVIEGTMSNLFIVEAGWLITPDLSQSGVAGVMRERVLEIAQQRDVQTAVEVLTVERLRKATACFVTNSLIGIWPVRRLDDINYIQGEEVTRDLVQALTAAQLMTKTG